MTRNLSNQEHTFFINVSTFERPILSKIQLKPIHSPNILTEHMHCIELKGRERESVWVRLRERQISRMLFSLTVVSIKLYHFKCNKFIYYFCCCTWFLSSSSFMNCKIENNWFSIQFWVQIKYFLFKMFRILITNSFKSSILSG